MKVIVMRGIPGSGKSTWVDKFVAEERPASGANLVSADYFHLDSQGIYKFDPANVREAHNWCMREFLHAVSTAGRPSDAVVLVDNTNTTAWEISPYYRAAEALGHEVEIVQMVCDPATAWARNRHGVPLDKVWAMHCNLITERLPPWWKIRMVPQDERTTP